MKRKLRILPVIMILVLLISMIGRSPVFAEEDNTPIEEQVAESTGSNSGTCTEIDETVSEDSEETEVSAETGVPVNEDETGETQEEGISPIEESSASEESETGAPADDEPEDQTETEQDEPSEEVTELPEDEDDIEDEESFDEESPENEEQEEEEQPLSDVTWNYGFYDQYAESMAGMRLYKTDHKVQFYNTFIDQGRLSTETTIDSLFDSSQEGYSTEYILGLNPVQLTEEAPVYKGEDGNYYAVTSVYEVNSGLDPRDSQPATSFYNYLAEAFTDIRYLGRGVFLIPQERYDYCFNGHYFTDGPQGNLVEIVFGLRIQLLYGYDPESMPTIMNVLAAVTKDGEKCSLPATLNMETGTIQIQLIPDDQTDSIWNYSMEAVVNKGEGKASLMSVSEDGKTAVFTIGDSHAFGALDIAMSSQGGASTGLISPPVIIVEIPRLRSASTVKAASTTIVNNITYLELPEGCVPSDLQVGDKFIYQHKNVYIAGVQNANDAGNYSSFSGTWNGTNPGTPLHTGANNISTHDAQYFCYYNDLSNWTAISNWFKQVNGYSALNDPTKPDTNTAIAGSMRQMTTANMELRAANNGTSSNLGGNRIFGYISEKLGPQTDTTGIKTLDLNQSQLIFACMHAWAYEGSTTPTEIGQALAAFTGTSEIARDQYCGNYFPNLGLQCTSVTQDGDYINATFKCCTSILGVGGVTASNRNNYQCAFSTLYVRYPNTTSGGQLTIEKKLSGSMASKTDTFDVEIDLKDSAGNAVNQTFDILNTWTSDDGTVGTEEGSITFTNGKAAITLRGGSTVTINGIPLNYSYKVTEADYSEEGYTTSYQNREGTITEETAVTITNERGGIVPTGIHTNAVPILASVFMALSLISTALMCMTKRRNAYE